MLRLLLQKPLTQTEIIRKYSYDKEIKTYSLKILALNEIEEKTPGHNFCIMA